MKKITTILLIVLLFLPEFSQNETMNKTTEPTNITETTWYEQIPFDTQGPEMTTLSVLIALVAVYILGKLAFKLIKWAIIAAIILLIIQVLL